MESTSNLLTFTESGGVTVVGFEGVEVLDAARLEAVSRQLMAFAENDASKIIVLDLGTIKMLASRALSLFLNLHHKVEPEGGKVVISGVNPSLYRVFKITNLVNVFEFYDDTDSAIKGLSPSAQ